MFLSPLSFSLLGKGIFVSCPVVWSVSLLVLVARALVALSDPGLPFGIDFDREALAHACWQLVEPVGLWGVVSVAIRHVLLGSARCSEESE